MYKVLLVVHEYLLKTTTQSRMTSNQHVRSHCPDIYELNISGWFFFNVYLFVCLFIVIIHFFVVVVIISVCLFLQEPGGFFFFFIVPSFHWSVWILSDDLGAYWSVGYWPLRPIGEQNQSKAGRSEGSSKFSGRWCFLCCLFEFCLQI